MSYKIKLLCLITLNLISITTYADSYIKAETAISIHKRLQSNDYNNSPNRSQIFGLGIGKSVNEFLNVEFSFYHDTFKFIEYTKDITYSQKFTTNAVFINADIAVVKYNNLTYYITTGAGISHNNAGTYKAIGAINGIRLSRVNIYPAFSVGTGIRMKLNEKIEASLGYKYFDLGKAKTSTIGIVGRFGAFDKPVVAKLNNHAIIIDVTYRF